MGKIRALGWIHAAVGALGLIGVLFILAVIAMSPDKESRAPGMILPPLFLLSAIWFLPSLVGGIGLLAMKPWARLMMIVVSGLYVLLLPVGTPLGLFGLWVLLRSGVGEAVVATVEPLLAKGPKVNDGLVAVAGVGAGFAVVIGAGFMISGDTAPAAVETAFYPGVVVFVGAVAYGIMRMMQPGSPPVDRNREQM